MTHHRHFSGTVRRYLRRSIDVKGVYIATNGNNFKSCIFVSRDLLLLISLMTLNENKRPVERKLRVADQDPKHDTVERLTPHSVDVERGIGNKGLAY